MVERLETIGNWLQRLADNPRGAMLALMALCLITLLPGVIRLPVVDRTETFFAESTRGMIERGDWLDPRYGEAVHKFRPIGTFWAQAVARRGVEGEHETLARGDQWLNRNSLVLMSAQTMSS